MPDRSHAIQADPHMERPITAAELLKVKQLLTRLPKLGAPFEPGTFAAWLREVVASADDIGGINRLAAAAEAYAALTNGKE